MSRDVKLITIALFLWGSGEGLFLYILPLYMEQLGASPAEVGSVLALAALLTACAFIPGGLLADRFDAKKVMIGGWALGAVSALWMGLAPTWTLFVPGVLLYNVSAYCIPAINTYIVEASGDLPLEHTITVTFAGYAAGSIVAPFVGGRLSEIIGTAPLFLIAAAIFLTSLSVAAQGKSHAHYKRHRDGAHPPLGQQLLRLKPAAPFFARMFFVFFATIIGMVLVANYLGTLGWNIGDVNSLGGTAEAIGMMVLAIGLGRLAARHQRRGMLLGQALVFTAMILFLLTTPAARGPAVIGYFLLGGVSTLCALANAQIAGQVGATARGTALGVNETLFELARSAASGLAGLLFTLDPRLPLIASTILIPIGMIWTALARTRPAKEDFIAVASTGNVILESLDD